MPHKRLTHLTHLTRNPENSSELMQPQLHHFFLLQVGSKVFVRAQTSLFFSKINLVFTRLLGLFVFLPSAPVCSNVRFWPWLVIMDDFSGERRRSYWSNMTVSSSLQSESVRNSNAECYESPISQLPFLLPVPSFCFPFLSSLEDVVNFARTLHSRML